MKKILAMIGSLSARSSNLVVAEHVAELLPDNLSVAFYDGIRHLPQFNPDLDNEDAPAAVRDLREAIAGSDLVFICTPEYVFGVPGALKNALDWTVSSGAFRGKPVALIVASLSGEKAFESLIKTLETIEAILCDGCTLLISHIKAKIGPNGKISHESTANELDAFARSLARCLGT